MTSIKRAAAIALVCGPLVAAALVAARGPAHATEAPVELGHKPFPGGKACQLHGKVKFVSAFADYKVQVVKAFPDIKVQKVSAFPDKPGKWQVVDAFPDFTVQLVDAFPDVKVQYVDAFPGCP